MATDWETRYYEQQANFTESNGMLCQERDTWKAKAEEQRARAMAAEVQLQATQRLQGAALMLYRAGYWTCDRPVDEAAMWTELRDALGLEPGTSPPPARGGGWHRIKTEGTDVLWKCPTCKTEVWCGQEPRYTSHAVGCHLYSAFQPGGDSE
jgi:hypothetical protein